MLVNHHPDHHLVYSKIHHKDHNQLDHWHHVIIVITPNDHHKKTELRFELSLWSYCTWKRGDKSVTDTQTHRQTLVFIGRALLRNAPFKNWIKIGGQVAVIWTTPPPPWWPPWPWQSPSQSPTLKKTLVRSRSSNYILFFYKQSCGNFHELTQWLIQLL